MGEWGLDEVRLGASPAEPTLLAMYTIFFRTTSVLHGPPRCCCLHFNLATYALPLYRVWLTLPVGMDVDTCAIFILYPLLARIFLVPAHL